MKRLDIYQAKGPMQWTITPEVEAARQAAGWREMHRACAAQDVCFDHVEKHGRREWECVAFATEPTPQGGWRGRFLSQGVGKTPIGALLDAYEKCGIVIPATAEPIARLRGGPMPADSAIDIEDILG